MAVLRSHRTPSNALVNPIALISLAFASFPWLLPTFGGLVAGLLAHVVWFAGCERFARPLSHPQPVAAPAGRLPSPAKIERARGFVQAPVLAVLQETPTVTTIRLARPVGFEFEAGQFITVRLRVEGKEYARCYSISSAPQARGYLEISIKRQGLVSSALHASLRPGAALFVKAPVGAFTYPADDDRPILLLAGGIGITPLISMLRRAIATEPARSVTLLYSARTASELAFREELQVIARRNPQVQIVFAVSGEAVGPDCYAGRLDETLLRATVRDLQQTIAMICGPSPMIDAMRATLTSLGVPPAQIRSEVFQAAIAASSGLARPSAAPAGASDAHQMQCRKIGRRVRVSPGQTLLEAAEDEGIAVPSLCRSGVCGTCRVMVAEGDIHCESSALSQEDRAEGFVFACVSTAHSDCVVDL